MKDFVLVYPNRAAFGLGAVALSMWYAGASQNNGAAYLLCFVVVALALVALPNTWANLRAISIRGEPIRPVFAGDEMRVSLVASTSSRTPRYSLRFQIKGSAGPGRLPELHEAAPSKVEVSAPAPRRGTYPELPVVLDSFFPFGFFTARKRIVLPLRYFVYPKAEGTLPLPQTFDPARDTREGARAEGDDYAGVRTWIPGESMRHIDWKAVSRGQPYMTKQWNSDLGHRLVLEWDRLPAMPLETRLSQLARWIVDAENQSLDYGLRLPGEFIPPERGTDHFHRCLRALASFPGEKS